jgi:hypothetical protein
VPPEHFGHIPTGCANEIHLRKLNQRFAAYAIQNYPPVFFFSVRKLATLGSKIQNFFRANKKAAITYGCKNKHFRRINKPATEKKKFCFLIPRRPFCVRKHGKSITFAPQEPSIGAQQAGQGYCSVIFNS